MAEDRKVFPDVPEFLNEALERNKGTLEDARRRAQAKQVTPTEALHIMGVEIPGGWEQWNRGRQANYVEIQKRRLKKETLRRTLVKKMADSETFRGGEIKFVAREGTDPDDPTFVIRGVYGPAAGLARSMVAVKLRDGKSKDGVEFVRRQGGGYIADEDRVVEHLEDWPGRGREWGPRQFLFNLFALTAKYGGDCELYLTHNKMEIGIDPVELEAWIRRSNEDPVRALLDTQTLLLEDKDRPT